MHQISGLSNFFLCVAYYKINLAKEGYELVSVTQKSPEKGHISLEWTLGNK